MMSSLAAIAPSVPSGIADRIESLGDQIAELSARQQELAELAGGGPASKAASALSIFQGYIGVLIAAFLVTLIVTPIVRRLAVANGVIDRPSEARKVHRMPIAYLGGVAVFLGLMAGVLYSYFGLRYDFLLDFHPTRYLRDGIDPQIVPLWIVLGFTIIAVVGLCDDVFGVSARVKVGGQLMAAAALAYGDIGTKVAAGVLKPTLGALLHNRDLIFAFNLPVVGHFDIDLVYWTGTAVIAIFVLGACNASNLIDGLDGLLSGVTAIAATGFLLIALALAVADDGYLDGPRIIICLAVLGACLGFLPHNFNPATIFLGDCGSLLLGYCSAVMILMLGDTGKTYLVVAGLIVYSIPIIDTILAIVRRKMAGKRLSDPDSDHLHHMLKRALGVKGAVLTLYSLAVGFAALGYLISQTRARFVYALALLFLSYIAVYAIKIARRKQIEEQALQFDAKRAARAASPAPNRDAEPVATSV